MVQANVVAEDGARLGGEVCKGSNGLRAQRSTESELCLNASPMNNPDLLD